MTRESGGALIYMIIITLCEAIMFLQGLTLVVNSLTFVPEDFDAEVTWKIISKQEHFFVVSHLFTGELDGQSFELVNVVFSGGILESLEFQAGVVLLMNITKLFGKLTLWCAVPVPMPKAYRIGDSYTHLSFITRGGTFIM
jgi:hypothetical protein